MADSVDSLLGIVPAIEHQYLTLREMADVGELMLEPDAATHAARACRELQEKLRTYAKTAEQLSKEVDFGQCSEGWALSKKFSLKAKGTPKSAYELLVKAEEILENMAETYEAAGRAYKEQEHLNAMSFIKNGN